MTASLSDLSGLNLKEQEPFSYSMLEKRKNEGRKKQGNLLAIKAVNIDTEVSCRKVIWVQVYLKTLVRGEFQKVIIENIRNFLRRAICCSVDVACHLQKTVCKVPLITEDFFVGK